MNNGNNNNDKNVQKTKLNIAKPLDYGCHYTLLKDASNLPLYVQIFPIDGAYKTKITQLNEQLAKTQ